MKIKDIKPGVVYGYRRGAYGTITPVVFLVAPGPDRLYGARRFASAAKPYFEHHPNLGRPRRGRYGDADVGYPVVFGRSDDDLAALASVTLDDFVAAFTSYDEDRHFTLGVVVTMAHIVGPYDTAVAEDERRQAAERKRYAEERARREAAQQHALRLVDELKGYGISAALPDWAKPAALVIPFDDVETLLSLLGGERP